MKTLNKILTLFFLTFTNLTHAMHQINQTEFVQAVQQANNGRRKCGKKMKAFHAMLIPFTTREGRILYTDELCKALWSFAESKSVIIPQKYLITPTDDTSEAEELETTCILCRTNPMLCLAKRVDGKIVAYPTACKHAFCTRCLATMLAYEKNSCPICKKLMFTKKNNEQELTNYLRSQPYFTKLLNQAAASRQQDKADLVASDVVAAEALQAELNRQQETEDAALARRLAAEEEGE